MNLSQVTQQVLAKIPSALQLNEHDMRLIRQHQFFFIAYEAELVREFYDLLERDSHLAIHIQGEQRQLREQTLSYWYRRTMEGRFDDSYWNWQVLIGVVHTKHKISNATLLSMWAWIVSFLSERLLQHLPQEEALAVIKSLHKLKALISALIIESYIIAYNDAISRASGLTQNLLDRLVSVEIDNILNESQMFLEDCDDPEHSKAA